MIKNSINQNVDQFGPHNQSFDHFFYLKTETFVLKKPETKLCTIVDLKTKISSLKIQNFDKK